MKKGEEELVFLERQGWTSKNQTDEKVSTIKSASAFLIFGEYGANLCVMVYRLVANPITSLLIYFYSRAVANEIPGDFHYNLGRTPQVNIQYINLTNQAIWPKSDLGIY